MYEMKPEYYIGVDSIDKEHTRLFDLARETHDLLNDNMLHDKTEKLESLLSELIDYTKTHFAHEEAYMEEIGYAHISAHKVLHRTFEESLISFDLNNAIENGEQDEAVESLLSFLSSWLIRHIQKVDRLYTKK